MNRKAQPLLLLFTLIISACSLCTKHGDCPAYDGRLMQRFASSYLEVDNTFYFADSNGNIDTVIIDNVSKTDNYTTKYQSGLHPDYYICKEISATVTSKTDEAHPGWVYMQCIDNEEVTKGATLRANVLTLAIKRYTISLREDFTGIKVEHPIKPEDFPITVFRKDTILGGKTYDNVSMIVTDNNDIATQHGIDKLFISFGYGIIGYRTYPEGRQYWLQ